MNDKIYKVKDGVLCSTPIIKETSKLYWINDWEFSYKSTFRKEHACVTPQEAVQEELNLAANQHAIFKKRYEKSKKRLSTAKELASQYLDKDLVASILGQ